MIFVFFSSIVLCDEMIRKKIIDLISYKNYELIFITLYATEETLRERAKLRDDNWNPVFFFLENSLKQESIFIDTSNKSRDDIVRDIRKIVDGE